MKLSLKILAIAIIAATTYSIIGCAAPASFSYQNIGITFTASCSDCPNLLYNPASPTTLLMANTGQGGTMLITANVTNAPANVTWSIFPQPNLNGIDTLPTSTTGNPGESGSSVGTINAQSGNTVYYTQGGVNVYSGAALQQTQALGIPQGDVLLVATVQSDPKNPSATVSAGQLIQVYNASSTQGPPVVFLTPHTPLTPAGLTNPVVTVPRNTSFAFNGGVVGAAPCLLTSTCTIQGTLYPIDTTDNQGIWEVGPSPFSLATAIPGGNSTLGTVTANGVYTAPAAIPPTPTGGVAGEVVVILISHLVPTVDSYANVLIN